MTMIARTEFTDGDLNECVEDVKAKYGAGVY
jgi:hypothetical protein